MRATWENLHKNSILPLQNNLLFDKQIDLSQGNIVESNKVRNYFLSQLSSFRFRAGGDFPAFHRVQNAI